MHISLLGYTAVGWIPDPGFIYSLILYSLQYVDPRNFSPPLLPAPVSQFWSKFRLHLIALRSILIRVPHTTCSDSFRRSQEHRLSVETNICENTHQQKQTSVETHINRNKHRQKHTSLEKKYWKQTSGKNNHHRKITLYEYCLYVS